MKAAEKNRQVRGEDYYSREALARRDQQRQRRRGAGLGETVGGEARRTSDPRAWTPEPHHD